MSEIVEDLSKMKGAELLSGIFGRKDEVLPVEVLTLQNAQEITKRIIEDATQSVDHITIVGRYNQFITNELLADPKIRKRVLLLNRSRWSFGFKALRSSEYQRPINFLKDDFTKRYQEWNEQLTISKNAYVRAYQTVPWFRGTIVDDKRAVFIISINLLHGTQCLYFYTHDLSTVLSLKAIFEDIWFDKRTISFNTYYKKIFSANNDDEHP